MKPIEPIDRIAALYERHDTVGLDFVWVGKDQVTLDVFFYRTKNPPNNWPQKLLSDLQPCQISIHSPSGGEWLPDVPLCSDPLKKPTWSQNNGRPVLRLTTAQPGDFSRYELTINHPKVDPYFNTVNFSFKAHCKSQFDCKAPPHECPPEPAVDYRVNYQARDFWSLRQALLDFASTRHPAWQDRLEADVGVMLAEAMSALGDEFAYYQDRVAREAYFETATQRRSLRRHARLIDYNLHDGLGGQTWLDFTVQEQPQGTAFYKVSAGQQVWVKPPNPAPEETAAKRRDRSSSVYEVGYGLAQGNQALHPALGPVPSLAKSYPSPDFKLRFGANEMPAYRWDVKASCLPAGSTELDVVRDATSGRKEDLPLEDFTNPKVVGKWVLLKTNPADSSVTARNWLVRLIDATELTDPLNNDATITRLKWEEAQATPFEMDLETLVVRGNIVPATAGQTLEAYFQVEPPFDAGALPAPLPPRLPEAAGAGGNPFFTDSYSSYALELPTPLADQLPTDAQSAAYEPSVLFSLPGSEQRDVIYHGLDLHSARPEVRVFQGTFPGSPPAPGQFASATEWEWKRAPLGVNSAQSQDAVFTLEDGTWRRVVRYRRVDETGTPQTFDRYDYANGRGATVRFGNGEFGQAPPRPATPNEFFRVVYRLGRGRVDNVAAESLTDFDAAALPAIAAVTNPLGVTNAVDPQTPESARHVAPEAYRAETFRAVRAEDYAAAVEKLPWVQRAGAQFRWTGSWLTLFATPDPKASFALTAAQAAELQQQLDRYRLAGRDAFGMSPKYANLDLEIHVCVEPGAYAGQVKQAVLEALFGRRGAQPQPGFFSPDNWTFGDPLERAALESAIQAVPGVRAVQETYIRRRGWFDYRLFQELVYTVAAEEIIRVQNDRQLPERGSVRLVMKGGA